MSKRSSLKVVQIISILFGLAALLVAPWGLPMIENPLWRISAWTFILLLVAGIAVCFGLAPYFGQKEITKEQKTEYEKTIKSNDKDRSKYNEEIERLKHENTELKRQLGS